MVNFSVIEMPPSGQLLGYRTQVANGLAANAREQVRSLLTHTVLQNVGVLSAMEANLITIAPLGAARYQAVVDAYTLGASQMIMGW
mgnify:CR=1 FL=1